MSVNGGGHMSKGRLLTTVTHSSAWLQSEQNTAVITGVLPGTPGSFLVSYPPANAHGPQRATPRVGRCFVSWLLQGYS